jgi:hypothetical protein
MQKRKKRKNTVTTMLEIQMDIKCQFKAYCARRGKTMTETIEEMMLDKIKKGE